MKKLLILLFSLFISFNSYANWEWIKVTISSENGNIFYIDKKTIKNDNGYVYWYELSDYKKPDKFGDMSAIIYSQGDCGVNRSRILSGIFFKQAMGTIESSRGDNPNPEWNYTFPGQIDAQLLDYACNNVN